MLDAKEKEFAKAFQVAKEFDDKVQQKGCMQYLGKLFTLRVDEMTKEQQHLLISYQMFEQIRSQTRDEIKRAKEFIAEVRVEVFN